MSTHDDELYPGRDDLNAAITSFVGMPGLTNEFGGVDFFAGDHDKVRVAYNDTTVEVYRFHNFAVECVAKLDDCSADLIGKVVHMMYREAMGR